MTHRPDHDGHSHPHGHSDEHTHAHEHSHEHEASHGHEHSHEHVTLEVDAATADDMARREARRAELHDLTLGDLEVSHEVVWRARRQATDTIVVYTEEMMARLVHAHFPTAAQIVLYEDTSHDAPHGHVLHIVDADGHVLIDGTGDTWHDAAWTDAIDDLVFDLHHLDREGFRTEKRNGRRLRRITVTVTVTV